MLKKKIEPLVKTDQSESFLSSPEFAIALAHDDGLAAKQHLADGRPIYYGDDRYPEGIVKKFPDGRQQLVSVDSDGKIKVIRDL